MEKTTERMLLFIIARVNVVGLIVTIFELI